MKAQNMYKTFSFVPSKKNLNRETYMKKSRAILQNFYFGRLKLTKTALLFIEPVSLVRGFLEGTRENIF